MKVILSSLFCIFLAACSTPSHYGKRPDFSQLKVGMSHQEVVEIMGKPDETAASNNVVYLTYRFTPWYDHNGDDGNAEDYFVRFIDNKVDSFGKKGDFDSTKEPSQTINVNVKQQ